MNRGFAYYFKKSWNLLFFSLRKTNFLGKCMLPIYLFVSFLGKLCFITRPIFVIADNNAMAMIKETRRFSFDKCFEGTTTKNRYLGLLSAFFVTDLIVIAVAAVLVAPFVIFQQFVFDVNLVGILINVMVIVTLIIALFVQLNYSAIGFIAHKTSELDTSDYLYNSSYTVKKIRGSLLGSSLLVLLAIFLFTGLPFILFLYFNRIFDSELLLLVSSIMMIVIYLVYFLIGAFFVIGIKLAHYLQFEDVALLKKTVVVKELPGVERKYAPLFHDQKDERIGITNKEEK